MRFVVSRSGTVVDGPFPVVTLRVDDWNDYGFVTMFAATLCLDDETAIELENVKVLEREMHQAGRVDLPRTFDRLPSRFCSLGQTPSYYQSLASIDPGVAAAYLKAMRDMARSARIERVFSQEPGYEASLLRFSAAKQALVVGGELFRGDAKSGRVERQLGFSYASNGGEPEQFSFRRKENLPTRIVAVVGYNGVGKTRLLANLAMVASADERERDDVEFTRQFGRLDVESAPIGGVIAIAYSAFDSFPIPGELPSEYESHSNDSQSMEVLNAKIDRDHVADGRTSARSYTYCGLRRLDDRGRLSPELKSFAEVEKEFDAARRLAVGKLRSSKLRRILAPLFEEPSFAMAGTVPSIDARTYEWVRVFDALSTGHKIVLNIIVQLCARLERNSLVLIDEPEMHLHPSLVAAFLKSIVEALIAFDSHAVVATHSPVVVQEIPASNVKVLRRSGALHRFVPPRIETFGETISALTSEVFHLDSSASDFQGVLVELAASKDIEEVEALFDGRMSSQARFIVSSEMRLRRARD